MVQSASLNLIVFNNLDQDTLKVKSVRNVLKTVQKFQSFYSFSTQIIIL
jgi:hypothetical protein